MRNLKSVMSGVRLLSFGVISSILIMLLSIAGCSDPSPTNSIVSNAGSMLTHADVDDYSTSITGGIYCIHNDKDSSCIDLVQLVKGGVDTDGPTIHIYPERTLYLFYHEGYPIARIERSGDTTDIIETLGDTDKNGGNGNNNNGNNGNGGDNNNGNNNDNGNNGNGDNNNPKNTDPTDKTSDGHGWLIWIYYPEGTAPINPPTLSESNVTVTINGKQLTDDDITGFAQFIGTEGEKGIQFFYATESAELLDLKVQMNGITDDEGNVRFNINYLWHAQ